MQSLTKPACKLFPMPHRHVIYTTPLLHANIPKCPIPTSSRSNPQLRRNSYRDPISGGHEKSPNVAKPCTSPRPSTQKLLPRAGIQESVHELRSLGLRNSFESHLAWDSNPKSYPVYALLPILVPFTAYALRGFGRAPPGCEGAGRDG